MNTLGIDLSIRATGLAMLSTDDSVTTTELPGADRVNCFHEGLWYSGVLVERKSKDKLAQWEDILFPLVGWARHAHQVIIEEYSHHSISSSMDLVHELGGIIKYHLRKMGHVPIEISPKSVKKFIAGNGNADKDQMLKCVQKAGLPIVDHNMADAYGLAKLGHALQQSDSILAGMHQTEREAIHAIKYPVIKIRKVKKPELFA